MNDDETQSMERILERQLRAQTNATNQSVAPSTKCHQEDNDTKQSPKSDIFVLQRQTETQKPYTPTDQQENSFNQRIPALTAGQRLGSTQHQVSTFEEDV